MCSSVFVKEVVLVLALLYGTVFSSNVLTDHLALLEIKSKITHDPQGVFTTWNSSLHFCHWQGVTCGRRHQRVTVLNLTQTELVGSLSPYIGNLSFLRYMLIQGNQLYGSIPSEIGRLSRLKVLSLPYNSFTGEIPVNISSCSKLHYFNLCFNKLSGKLPNIFSSMPMLKTFLVSSNNFSGGIPSYIGNISSLETLFIANCPLGGSIPESLNHLKNLRDLGLGIANLVGDFPLLFNLSMLESIDFSENRLHGSLPKDLCLSQPHLRRLGVGRNHLDGFLPPSISNCSDLQIIDVDENNFRGEIAIDFGQLQNLKTVILSSNGFESMGLDGMKIFDSLSNCSKLYLLDLGLNHLTGVLPSSLGNFSSRLHFLSLNTNYISGQVPKSIGNLVGLSHLSLGSNNFMGMIPDSIGKLQNLQILYLENNGFSGIIPTSIGNLSSVLEVALSGNKLEGAIPSTIGTCNKLLLLELSGNNLRGHIPKTLFQLSSLSILLDLSQNNLSGVLPQEIGNLKVLATLDLSENRLSGELPNSFGSCISLQFLNLSSNFLHGSMTEALSSLKGLEYVDMSRNNLSGHIPSYMQHISLMLLNLSYNNFEGEVPIKGVFANTSAISVIGNQRLCGGVPELNLPKCATNESKRSRWLFLRVVIAISLSSTFAALALVSFALFYCCKKKRSDKPSESMMIEPFEKISFERLFKATQGFSSTNLIGTGSFASVFKGVLDENGLTVAIKVLNLQRRGGSKSFMAECDTLRNIRHCNLVKVITCCSSLDFKGNDFKALVYDFMPNGSLESWLHMPHDEVRQLDLVQRISIAKDVASALEYLHCRNGNVVVHCDLKPSNILLDADMVAHVGDFGLAKIISPERVSNGNESFSSLIRGTIGYTPPEYGLGNEVSPSGDIYSYGILLLEILTGIKPVDPMFEEGQSLYTYARTALNEGSVIQIVDPMLVHKDVNEESLISLVKVGVQCSSESPQDRMDIKTVVHELFSIYNSFN